MHRNSTTLSIHHGPYEGNRSSIHYFHSLPIPHCRRLPAPLTYPRRSLTHSSWPLALPSIRSQLSHSSYIADCLPLYPRRLLPHFSSLLAPHPLPALVHLIHFRSPSSFIAAAAPFIVTTTLVHSLLLFFCLRSPPPDSFTVTTTRHLIRKRQSLFLTGVPFSSAAASSSPFI